MEKPRFIIVTCQIPAVPVLKAEIARLWPGFRFAYSRPGFLTFKLPEDHQLKPDFHLGSVFARTYCFSLGRVPGESMEEMAANVWRLYGDRPVDRIHVWSRDSAAPGEKGFEPGPTDEARAVHEAVVRACPNPAMLDKQARTFWQPARVGQFVLDLIVVRPGEWWLGFHCAHDVPSCWPGGMIDLKLPDNAVSRAWLKMEEALRWSQLPIKPGARCAEIGSAPGGSTQALLGRGLIVTGIDPAQMHPDVLAHPNFTHIRRRAAEVSRRVFRDVRWLMTDINAAPNYTLDVVESIVTHRKVHIQGMILMLKFLQWKQAEWIDQYVERVRSWGFNIVKVRQLQFNRQEACLAALKEPFNPPVRRHVRARGRRRSAIRKAGQPHSLDPGFDPIG